MALLSTNPSTGKKIQSYHELNREQVKKILENVYTAKDNWASSDFSLRLGCVNEMIGVLEDNKKELVATNQKLEVTNQKLVATNQRLDQILAALKSASISV